MEPLALAVGGLLALRISFMYSKQLRLAFVFFSIFLFIYAAAIVLFSFLQDVLIGKEEVFTTLVLVVQAIDYVFLILFSINLLKVIKITNLNSKVWIIIGITAVICLFMAVYPPLVDNLAFSDINVLVYMIIRIVDAGLVVALVPIIWLYVAYLKSQQRQSLTFTVIISGIICATIFNYIHEVAVRMFAAGAITDTLFFYVIPDTLFIFGYLVILVGLYAHLKDEQWGFNAVDKFMSGELELIENVE